MSGAVYAATEEGANGLGDPTADGGRRVVGRRARKIFVVIHLTLFCTLFQLARATTTPGFRPEKLLTVPDDWNGGLAPRGPRCGTAFRCAVSV